MIEPRFDHLDVWKNTVGARHAARVAGVRYDEFMDAAESLRFQTLNGRLERHEIRKVLAKLIVRTSDSERIAMLRAAVRMFANEADA